MLSRITLTHRKNVAVYIYNDLLKFHIIVYFKKLTKALVKINLQKTLIICEEISVICWSDFIFPK